MPIKTNLKPVELMKLNPWIKTMEHAEKILKEVRTGPSVSLDDLIKQRSKK